MLTQTQDEEQIIARVAALDIGKAALVCCVRVPDEDRPGRALRHVISMAKLLDDTQPGLNIRAARTLAHSAACGLRQSWQG